jgi:hypothetical protein
MAFPISFVMLAVPVTRANARCRGGADALRARIHARLDSGLILSVSMSPDDTAHTLRQLQRAGLTRDGADPDIAGLDMTRGLLWPCPWLTVAEIDGGLVATPVWEVEEPEEEMSWLQHSRQRPAAAPRSPPQPEADEAHWIQVALRAHPGVFGRLEAADTAARRTLTEAERRQMMPFSAKGDGPRHAPKRALLAALGRGELSETEADLKMMELILRYYCECEPPPSATS